MHSSPIRRLLASRSRPLVMFVVLAIVATVTAITAGAPGERVATAQPSGGWTTSASVDRASVGRGERVSVSVRVTAEQSQEALVDLEIYNANGDRVYQRVWDRQAFTAGQMRSFRARWTVPAGAAVGVHEVRVGVFRPGWGVLYQWNDSAASFSVTEAQVPPTTVPPSSTTTPAPTTAPPTSTTTTAPPSTTTTAPPSTTTTAPPSTTTTAEPPGAGLPPVPTGFPTTFELGVQDGPGGASALRAWAPMVFRYQYLAGGVNTGGGWATWNPDGHFVTNYVQESRQAGVIPVFSYYMLYQSAPGVGIGEPDGVYANLTNSSTMSAYYADLALFFQRAGEAGGTTVLHVEPDLWAYLQRRATGDDAHTVPVRVGASGMADVAGLPDNAAGFAQAIVRLRDLYAPNVTLGYHFSTWATGDDFLYSDPPDDIVDALGVRTAGFYQSLEAGFDVGFTELADRDAGFKQFIYGDGGASWFTPDDYRRSATFIGAFVRTARLRAVVWQVPVGNTKMRAVNNTWNHFQDNKVEWLLDDPGGAHVASYAASGVVAFLFGRGADGVTCWCDANADGVTNPPPINGNSRDSLSADDDGGYLRERVAAYYQTGAAPLPG